MGEVLKKKKKGRKETKNTKKGDCFEKQRRPRRENRGDEQRGEDLSWWKNKGKNRKVIEGRRRYNKEEKKVETKGRQTNEEELEKKNTLEEKEGKQGRREEHNLSLFGLSLHR